MDDAPWRLGAIGPVQQSPVTCGSASLTVARMLADPGFARWVVTGVARDGGSVDGRSEPARFGAYERTVMARTNALVGAGGRLQLPWPRALGTPPWGARNELEAGAAVAGTRYGMRVVRVATPTGLRGAYRHLVSVVGDGRPGLLYVGDALCPRHVALVLRGNGDAALDVYDPATGTVTALDQQRFAGRRLRLAGWDIPWAVLQPDQRATPGNGHSTRS